MSTKYDIVNQPEHYVNSSMECIDVMIAVYGLEMVVDFCILNAFKYRWRYKNKNGLEDLKKGKWYVDKGIDLMEDYQHSDEYEKRFLLYNIRSSIYAAIQEEDLEDEDGND